MIIELERALFENPNRVSPTDGLKQTKLPTCYYFISHFVELLLFDTLGIIMTSTISPASLQGVIDSWVHGGSLPMAQLSVRSLNAESNEAVELFYGQSGYLNLQREDIKRDSIFRIYSMTKPIICVAILRLVDRGLLHLHDPVSKFIPSFEHMSVLDHTTPPSENPPLLIPLATPVTIQHLMSHTSGITYGIFGNNEADKVMRGIAGAHIKEVS